MWEDLDCRQTTLSNYNRSSLSVTWLIYYKLINSTSSIGKVSDCVISSSCFSWSELDSALKRNSLSTNESLVLNLPFSSSYSLFYGVVFKILSSCPSLKSETVMERSTFLLLSCSGESDWCNLDTYISPFCTSKQLFEPGWLSCYELNLPLFEFLNAFLNFWNAWKVFRLDFFRNSFGV